MQRDTDIGLAGNKVCDVQMAYITMKMVQMSCYV